MSLTHIHLWLYACQGSIWEAFWVPAALPHWTKSLQRVYYAAFRECIGSRQQQSWAGLGSPGGACMWVSIFWRLQR